jgi:hypothetical protein
MKIFFIEKILIYNEGHASCFITTKLTYQKHFQLAAKSTASLIITHLHFCIIAMHFKCPFSFHKHVTNTDHLTATHLAAVACEVEPCRTSVCTRRNSSTCGSENQEW